MTNLIVIGDGPAGVLAALRGADLGQRTVLVAHDGFGGMAANDGQVPVRVLAHAARPDQLGTGGAALFPVMLYSTLAPENSITAYAVNSNQNVFLHAVIWWPIGLALAIGYFVFISRRYAGKSASSGTTRDFTELEESYV